jgi:1-acyl-sn-glycerol-3-phosphate acyltransferase
MNVFPEASMLVHSFLSKVPIVGFLLKSTGATFVQRKRFGRTKHAIDETLKHIEKKSIIILPEGGRSPDGRIRKFKRGFIYILRHSSMDLLPVTLRGFYGLKPMKRVYLDPDSDLEVVIHKPINHSVVESLNDEVLLKLTVDTIERAYEP